MKKYVFISLLLFLFTTKIFSQSTSQRAQTINALDTVVFDLSQSVITGNNVWFPVSILSDDTIYALDFSLKYNQNNLAYDSIINLTNYLQPFSYYNSNDSTWRFTSNSLQQITNDTPLVSVSFNLIGGLLTNSDLYTIKAYLNGTQCSIKLNNVSFIGIDEIEKKEDGMQKVFVETKFSNPRAEGSPELTSAGISAVAPGSDST